MKRPLLLLLIAATTVLISCSSNSYPGSTPYPSTGGRNEQVVILKDGRIIDRNGRVIGNTRNLPPGQAKKIYGSRSARDYSYGHRKKPKYYNNDKHNERRDRDYDRRDRDYDD